MPEWKLTRRLTNKTNNMRYNGNNKEIKDAILKENQPYLYSELNRLTKLELLDVIQSRDERQPMKETRICFMALQPLQ